jgi:hypothetical protein
MGGSSGCNNVRVTDAKEVGVGNPAEETFYHPNSQNIAKEGESVKPPLENLLSKGRGHLDRRVRCERLRALWLNRKPAS